MPSSACNIPLMCFVLIGLYSSGAEANSSPRALLEEVVVLGTKMERSLMDTPNSVTVIDSELVKRANINNLRDLDRFAPNVSTNQIGQVGATSISIRGIQSNPFVVNRVAVYVDGIPLRDPETVRLNNVEQIEILRGPQSTLYGANANAGIIVITSVKPEDEFNGSVGLTYNQFEGRNTFDLSGYAEGALTESLSGSFSVNLEQGDSYIKNISSSINEPGEIKDLSINARTYYQVSDSSHLNVIAGYNKTEAPGLYEQEFPALNRSLYNSQYSQFNREKLVGDFEIANDAPKDTDEKEWVLGLAFQHQFNAFTLDVDASYRDKKDQSYGTDLDLTGAAFSAGGTKVEDQFSNLEFRLSSKNGEHFDWVVGGSYIEHRRSRVLSTLIGPGGLQDFSSAPEQRFETRDSSIFGQVLVPLTEQLKLSVGLRYENSERVTEQDEGQLDLGPIGIFGFPAVVDSKKEGVLIPKVSLSYQFAPDASVYATAAKGYLPGGYNLVAAGNGSDIANRFGAYDKETLWSYELGVKTYFYDNRIFLSGAIFYIDAPSWQENRILTDDNGRVLSTNLISSAAAITSKGAELEISADVTDKLRVNLGVGYSDAEYKDYPFSSTQNLAGKKVYLIPEFDVNAAVSYSFSDNWTAYVNVTGTGETPLNPAGETVRDTLVVADAGVSYETGNWLGSVFIENITNKRYAAGQAYQNFLLGDDGNYYAPLAAPRIIGVKTEFKF